MPIWRIIVRLMKLLGLALILLGLAFCLSLWHPAKPMNTLAERNGIADYELYTPKYKAFRDQVTVRYHLDKPAFYFGIEQGLQWHGADSRFHYFLKGVLSGSFGSSYFTGQAIGPELWRRFTWSFFLTVLSVVFATLLAARFAIWQVSHAHTRLAKWGLRGALVMLIIPSFALASAGVYLLASPYGWPIFPSQGVLDPVTFDYSAPAWRRVWYHVPYMILPVLVYTVGAFAYIAIVLRDQMLDLQQSMFAKLSAAQGFSPHYIARHRLFPNASLLLITILGRLLPATFAGSVIIESFFNIPGMGAYLLDAVIHNDTPVLIAIFVISGMLTLLSYHISDFCYKYFNPELRFGTER